MFRSEDFIILNTASFFTPVNVFIKNIYYFFMERSCQLSILIYPGPGFRFFRSSPIVQSIYAGIEIIAQAHEFFVFRSKSIYAIFLLREQLPDLQCVKVHELPFL